MTPDEVDPDLVALAQRIAAVNGGPVPEDLLAEIWGLGEGRRDQLRQIVLDEPEAAAQRRATWAAITAARGDTFEKERRQREEDIAAAADPETDAALRRQARAARGGPGLVIVADVKPERVRWLWPKRIPLGKITVLDGDPGLGKSTLTLDLAARVSTGSPLPDRVALDHRGAVLIVSAEDGIGDTIRPRLAAAGADLERITVLDSIQVPKRDGTVEERPLVLPVDLDHLEEAITTTGAVLVILDPLSAFLGGEVDSYKDQHVRRALMPLARLAERTGVAILIVRHLSKSGGPNALYRGGGSIAIIGAARAGLLVAPDPGDPTRRILASTKSNLAPMTDALAYRVVSDDLHDCGRIAWEGPTKHRADDLLAAPAPPDDLDETSALAAAVAFLEEVLAEGDLWTGEVKEEAKAAGVAWRTVERAKARLGVTSIKVGRPGDDVQGWKYHLPEVRQIRPEGRQGLSDERPGHAEGGQDRLGVDGVGDLRDSDEEGEGR